MIWWPILLGLILGSFIDLYVPDAFIQKHLSQKASRSILIASFLGFLMAACSHGILALAMQLYKKGARTSSVITFLLAAPWANLAFTFLILSFFEWKGLIIILSAIFIAILVGFLFLILEKKGWVETHSSSRSFQEKVKWSRLKNISLTKDAQDLKKSFINLCNMVLWWIALGFLIAVFIRAYFPTEYFHEYLSSDFLGLLGTLAFASFIEVCSEGSAPLAFELYHQLEKIGPTFVFLMAGVATDYTEIGLIASNIGKKAAIWLPILSIPFILIVALMMNLFL